MLLLGCSKDNSGSRITLSGWFDPGNIVYYDAPAMYVKNQVISDTGIINPYLRQKNAIHYFVYTSTATADPVYWSFEFLTNDSITVFDPSGNNTIGFKADIERNGADILMNRRDSMFIPNASDPLFNTRCSTMVMLGTKYPPRINRYPSQNYSVYYPTYFLKEIDDILYIPASTYVANYINSPGTESCQTIQTSNLGNILKESYPVASLEIGDTIVIQQRRIRLTRR